MFENFRLRQRLDVSLVSVLVIIILTSTNAHILKTRLGLLEGTTKEASHKKYFHAYYGIPYAKAPVGKLRFEPPVKTESWIGVLDATQIPPPCPEFDQDTGLFSGQEDCLYLHVFTPENVTAGQNYPVLFYIFGGRFYTGYPARHGPEYFMSRDIVMVMTNYRLGALGFLSTGDTVIPGNMALKDQVMALKWTNENIYDFGGDPRRVTLHGHSGGSTCVHLHTMSPLSENYFHRVIMQSGLSTNPAMVMDRDIARGVARCFAAQLNCTGPYTSESMKRCFQERTAKELVSTAQNLSLIDSVPVNAPLTALTPVIEDENVEDAFLTKNPHLSSYVSSKKPWLLGITRNEGASRAPDLVKFIGLEDPKLTLPIMADLTFSSRPQDLEHIAWWLKIHFFGEENIANMTTEDMLLVSSKMKSGVGSGLGLIDAVEKYEGVKYVYLFDYRYVGGYTNNKKALNGRFLGATHGDELPIMFKKNESGVAEEDLAFGDEMITRWVNFVYSGNPNTPFPLNTNVFGTWNPVSSSRIEFLRIDRHGSMEKDYLLNEYKIWRTLPLFSKYLNTFRAERRTVSVT